MLTFWIKNMSIICLLKLVENVKITPIIKKIFCCHIE